MRTGAHKGERAGVVTLATIVGLAVMLSIVFLADQDRCQAAEYSYYLCAKIDKDGGVEGKHKFRNDLLKRDEYVYMVIDVNTVTGGKGYVDVLNHDRETVKTYERDIPGLGRGWMSYRMKGSDFKESGLHTVRFYFKSNAGGGWKHLGDEDFCRSAAD